MWRHSGRLLILLCGLTAAGCCTPRRPAPPPPPPPCGPRPAAPPCPTCPTPAPGTPPPPAAIRQAQSPFVPYSPGTSSALPEQPVPVQQQPAGTPPPDVVWRPSPTNPTNPTNPTPPTNPGPTTDPSASPPQVRLSPPEPVSPDGKGPDSVRLAPPQPDPADPNPAKKMPQGADSSATPAPVEIPGFVVVKPGLATGQQPFPDGITWLQSHGYRAVLYLKAAGEDDRAAQRQFEKHGLKYLSLEVSPNPLTPEAVDRFRQLVADQANQPLFVYDKDGSAAPALWYLYFRLTDGLPDDKARAEAVRLGLNPELGAYHQAMWNAARRFAEGK